MGRFRYFLCYLRPRVQALLVGFALFGCYRLMAWTFGPIFSSPADGYVALRETAPAWSPDGSKIMFVNNGDIYTSDANGNHRPRMIIYLYGHASLPRWSPDGKRIVYICLDRYYAWVCAVSADGSNRRDLSERSISPGVWADWSPDGTRIAYVFYTEESALWVMSADGNYRWQISDDVMTPAWSPDGFYLVYAQDGAIYLRRADNSGDARNLSQSKGNNTSPAWSPDGVTIAFVSDRDGNAEIYAVNTDGSDPRNLTNHAANDHSPVWSPDGTRIAFISDRDGNEAVYLMNADGSDQHRLMSNPSESARGMGVPAWSPDGRSLAVAVRYFGSPSSGELSRIYVVDADGANLRCLTCLD